MIDRIMNGGALIAGALLILAMLLTCSDVVTRHFLRLPQAWVLELVEYSMLYITFLAAAWVLKKDGHIKMDLLVTRFGVRVQVIARLTTSIICALTCFVLVVFSIQGVWNYYLIGFTMSSPISPPAYLIFGIIPIGSMLLGIQFMRNISEYIRLLRLGVVSQAETSAVQADSGN